MHLRRSALRLYFRTARQLGLCSGDPTLDLMLPARSSLHMRPLSDDEVALCRSFSVSGLTETRRPAAWALAEAKARTSEIPHIRIGDIDVDEDRVWLWGSTKAEPRWGGLTKEPDVRPHSVVAWAGRRVLSETSHIEAVAKALGARSLDRAASLIGWDWREEGEQGALSWMATTPTGVSRLQALEAVLMNPELYRLAEEIPFPDRERGGRTRAYPNFAYLFYEALISVYRSARQVEAELSHPVVWRPARRMVRKMFPDDREMRCPANPCGGITTSTSATATSPIPQC